MLHGSLMLCIALICPFKKDVIKQRNVLRGAKATSKKNLGELGTKNLQNGKVKSRERERDDDDDGDDGDEICEVMNGTKKVNNECLFIVFTSQELEAPLT